MCTINITKRKTLRVPPNLGAGAASKVLEMRISISAAAKEALAPPITCRRRRRRPLVKVTTIYLKAKRIIR